MSETTQTTTQATAQITQTTSEIGYDFDSFPISAERYLQQVSEYQSTLARALQGLQSNGDDINLASDFHNVQKQFSSLKDKFFFLETKLGVLEALQDHVFFESITDESTETLRSEVSGTKKILSTVKRNTDELKGKIRESIQKLSEQTKITIISKEHFQKIFYSSPTNAEDPLQLASILQENEVRPTFGNSPPGLLLLDTISKCQSVIENQLRIVEQLENHLSELEHETNQDTLVLQNHEKKIKSLNNNIKNLKNDFIRASKALPQSQEQIHWLTEATNLIKILHGIQVDVSEIVFTSSTPQPVSMIAQHTHSDGSTQNISYNSSVILRISLKSTPIRPGITSPNALISITLTPTSTIDTPNNLSSSSTSTSTSTSISLPNDKNENKYNNNFKNWESIGYTYKITHFAVSVSQGSPAILIPDLSAITNHAIQKQDIRFFVLNIQRRIIENAHQI